MSAGKHTLGPWHRNIKPVTRYPVIFAGRNIHVAKVLDQGIGLSESEANADLIAAAPELLSACMGLLSIAETGVTSLGTIRAARAAIAKATGSAS